MTKRWICMALAALMVLGMLPMNITATETTTQTATYLGCDTTTMGAWEGKYGEDTAILYGYAGTMDETEIKRQKESLDTNKMTISNAAWDGTTTLVYQKDAATSVLDSQSFNLGGTNVFAHAGYYSGTSDAPVWNSYNDDPAVLNMPTAIGGTKYRVYATGRLRYSNAGFYGNLAREGFDGLYGIYDVNTTTNDAGDKSVTTQTVQGRFTLKMKTNGPHMLSLYGYAPLKNQSTYPMIISILDGEDNLLLRQAVPVDAFNNGAYLSFEVTGQEFNIIVEARDCCANFGISGIFIDTPPENVSDFAAEQVDAGVKLSWAFSGDDDVTVQRRESGTAEWTTLESVSAGTTTYTDTAAMPGKTYEYRLYVGDGILPGSYTDVKSVTVAKISGAEFVGKSAVTGGDWVGKVGKEGYYLPFYTVYETYQPKVNETDGWTVVNGRYVSPTALDSSGRTRLNSQDEGTSLLEQPSYLSSLLQVGTSDGYQLVKGCFETTDNTTAPQDPRDGATTRNKAYVRANPGFSYKFQCSDNAWHYMTVYVASYEYNSSCTYSIILGTNENAEPAVSYTATKAELKEGTYITFKVRGDFILKANMLSGSDAAFVNGIYFDAVTNAAQISGLTASQSGDGVTLSWTGGGTEPIVVQRAESGTEVWTSLITLEAGATSFTDATVQKGSSYDYRLTSGSDILAEQYASLEDIKITRDITPPFTYISSGHVTGGDWIGKVGSAGYFLPFYTISETYNGCTLSNGRYTEADGCDGTSLQAGSSLVSLPEDIKITAETATKNGYSVGQSSIGADYYFGVTQDARAPQDPRDNGATRKLTYVRSNPRLSYQFDMPEGESYYVTIYTTDYESGISNDFALQIWDAAGTEMLAAHTVTVDDMKKGVYTTFKVTGDFTLRLEGTSYVFMNAVFFDKAPEWEAESFTAIAGSEPRSAKLSWSYDGSVAIERKKAEDSQWQKIAFPEAGTAEYTDKGLDANSTYVYRIVPTSGILYGVYSEEKSIVTPTYTVTELTVDQSSCAVTTGQTVTVTGTLKLTDGTALAGKTVSAKLAGLLVDEGFVEADWGTAAVGEDGSFTVQLPDLPGGTYTLTLRFDAVDGEEQLAQSTAEVAITVSAAVWAEAPKLLTVSDGVAPGEYFSISGYGMNLGAVEVRIGTGSVDEATVLPIAQYDATDGYFIQLQLPESMAAGTYKLWVKNEHGWSEPILLNGARPLFISENSAWAGQTIKISGRNLLGSQYEAQDATAVRLVNASGSYYSQTITENNPYKIAFTVTGAPAGEYTVEVTNDGVNWIALSSGQTLTVVAEGQDPLGLGVAWADAYNWDNRISVLDHGATGDDTADDTAAIQAAINAAAANGGVVYLPAGSYYVSHLAVPAHVVILGQSKDDTYLYYNGTDGKYMFESTGTGAYVGYQGFARFTIRLADENYQPDTYFWLGYGWGGETLNNKYTRENACYFVSEVNIDTDVLVPGSNRGLGIIPIIGEHFLMQDCHFVGDQAIISSGYVRAYATIRNCYMEFAQGVPQMNASYTFIEDTDVVIHYETGLDSHGITVRDNSHVEDCYVYGAGSGKSNDGETMLAEATSFYDYGSVVRVDGNKILLNGTKTVLKDFQLRWGDVAIMIIDGKGIGQYRYIDMDKFDWSNPSATEFYVTEGWDIEPDSTSVYTLVPMIENVTFYRNKTEDGVKGIWFYGNVNDGVIAENTSINTEGIFAYSSQTKGTSRFTVSYRTTIRDNELYGVARESNRTGIYTHAQRNGVQGQYVAVAVYGLDVKDNRIYGDPDKTPVSINETPRHSGIVISSCEISSDTNCISELGQADTSNVIVQGNQLFNLKEGILVTSCTYGTVIADNYFEDVQAKLNKLCVDSSGTSEPLMLLSDITDEPQTQPACTDHLWLESVNCLECGWCGAQKAAQIGTAVYATLDSALEAAEAGQTVQLLTDVENDGVLVKNGISLDLNGHKLTSDYVIGFTGSQVLDSIGDGLLISENVRLASDNDTMPVWVKVSDEEAGYRFFTVVDYQKYRWQEDNSFQFISKPAAGAAANDGLIAEAAMNEHLTVKMRLSWMNASGNEVEQNFTMKKEDVYDVYTVDDYLIQLTVTGTANYKGLISTTTVIESDTGVVWAATAQLYTGAQN